VRSESSIRQPWLLTLAAFVLLAAALTWPLPARLTTSVPGDLGDPLFISWVMSWVASHVSHPSTLGALWDAPIFYPERGALTFSEHFIPQTLMVLPLYWATHNPILCYNVAFLISYILTGAGTALLTRALTGSLAAGLFAGVVAAFNEYRLVWEVAHLQTLSIYWFPFVLLGVHRYLTTGRRGALAGAAAAWIALNLSSVYYLAYCAPIIAIFTLVEVARLGRWRDATVWKDFAIGGVLVGVVTAPFLWPYVEMQQRLNFQRTPQEIIANSATLDAYRVALPRLEVPIALAGLALLAALARLLDRREQRPAAPEVFSPVLAVVLFVFVVLSMWLSLGPVVQFGGRVLDIPAIYPLFARLPGYSGLRVPARFASLFLIFLAMLGGLALGLVVRRSPKLGHLFAAAAIVTFLYQGRAQRVPLDNPLPSAGLAPAPAYLAPSPRMPAIYRAVSHLPASAVVAEFPFGDPWYDVRYMFFAASHERALVNGYSGVFPPSYRVRQSVLGRPFRNSDRAWSALDVATHAIVHKSAWTDDTGTRIAQWLEERGATSMGEIDGATLYQLHPVTQ